MDFRQWLEGADELEDFYRDNEKKVLEDPEIKAQLQAFFQASDPTIRKILGVNSEDPRGNFFVRTFNGRHGDWYRHISLPRDPGTPKPAAPLMPEETLRWFRGSKVVNGDGSPKVVYHGTQETFEAFEAGEFGFHFGDEEASGLHAGLDGPTRYLIKIKRPLRMKDLGVWYPHDAIREVVKVLNLPMKKANKALEDTDRLGELLAGQIDQDEDFIMNRRAFYKWSTPAREFIKSLGYDGIVYRNEAEGFNDSYIVFENDQIRRLPG